MNTTSDVWWIRYRWLLLAGIILLGGFLRLYLLDSIPPGLHPDEAINGLDALHALEAADYRVFYPANGGREGLFINLVALMTQIFGASPWVIRVTAALIGIATLPAMAFLAYEFGLAYYAKQSRKTRDRLATALMLAATLLLALSVWHMHFSRLGIRAVLLPLFAAASLGFLLRGFRRGRTADFAFSGMTLGLALLTYGPAQLLPLVFAVPFLITGWQYTNGRPTFIGGKTWLRQAGVFVIILLLMLLPAFGYFAAHPGDFGASFAGEFTPERIISRVGQTLAMFHLTGSDAWQLGSPDRPVLDPFSGALLLIGFLLLMRRLLRSRMALLLTAWFAVMVASAAAGGSAHAALAFGILLPVVLISAIGAVWLFQRLEAAVPETLKAGTLALLVVLVLLFSFHQYFFAWAPAPQLDDAFRGDLTRISTYLNERITARDTREEALAQKQAEAGEDTETHRMISDELQGLRATIDYVIVNEGQPLLPDGIPLPAANIRYLTREHPDIAYLTQDALADVVPIFGETVIVLTEAPGEDLAASIQAAFPGAARQDRNGYTVYIL